jgi:AraC-like DNA-binding protein
MSEMKDAGIFIRLVNQAMQNMGIDIASIYRKCGITPAHLTDTQLRTPHDANVIFWQAAEDITNDSFIGLHIAEHMPVFKGQVLEYLFLSSPTFGDGLNRALNYQRLLSDAAIGRLERNDEGMCLVIKTSGDNVGVLRTFNDFVVYIIINFFNYVTENEFTPTRINFMYDAPSDISEYERLFHCPVFFNQLNNSIQFNEKVMSRASLHAESELLELHEQLADQHVAKLERQDVVILVSKIIGELLETGTVNLEVVAERMNIKPRNLRSRLSEADTNFNQLLSDYRCNLAKHLLVRTSESIDEIVYLTGFSEPSTFYRAFKRWTKMTPIEYRKLKSGSRD